MADYYTDALGIDQSYGSLTATDVNPNASGPNDWQTVALNGVRQLVGAASLGLVAREQAQIAQNNGTVTLQASPNAVNLLVIGAVIWLIMKV